MPRRIDPYQQTVFFTDRAIYRPGQMIYFKGLCLNVDRANNDYKLLAKQAVRVVFRDANRQEITASDPALLHTPAAEEKDRLIVSKNHMGNFFDCVRSRQLPICDVVTGHRSATMCHLGAIALRTGLKLTWDYGAERFVGENAGEANRYLSRPMRAPYDYSFSG